jgi:hypothetical protein
MLPVIVMLLRAVLRQAVGRTKPVAAFMTETGIAELLAAVMTMGKIARWHDQDLMWL